VLTAPPSPPRRSAGPLLVAVAVAVVAAGIAVWALVSMVVATDDRDDAERALAEAKAAPAAEAQPVATVRDDVSVTAQEAIAVLNTLDHRTLDEDLEAWAEVTTGELHDQIITLAADQRDQLEELQAVTEGRVDRIAVRDLDDEEGTATVLAAVEVVKESKGAERTTAYQRLEATLTRTDDGWKLSDLSSVPYEEPR